MVPDPQPQPGIAAPTRSIAPWIVAAVSATVQSLYLLEWRKDPTFVIPIVDSATYHDAAVRFANGEPLWNDAFWQPPLLALGMGCLYWVFGVNIVIAKATLALLNVASCVLTYRLGARAFSRRVGCIAGLLLACYGPFVVFGAQLLPGCPAVFLCLCALLCWQRCMQQPRLFRWLLLGILIGLAMLTVVTSAVLAILAAVSSLARPRALSSAASPNRQPSNASPTNQLDHAVSPPSSRLTGRLVRLATLCFGWLLVVAPVTIRNYASSSEFVLISTNGGINLFVGNNPDTDRTLAARPGEAWRRIVRESFPESGAISSAQQDAYFRAEVLRYVRESPVSFLAGMLRKVVELANSRELPRTIDPNVYRDFSILLSALMWRVGSFGFPWGVVFPLAVFGWLATRRDPSTLPDRCARTSLLWFAALYGAGVALFFVSSRYRLPMVPVVVVFAAAGIQTLVARFTLGRNKHRAPLPRTAVVGGSVALVFANWPIQSPLDAINFRAELEMCVGYRLTSQGDWENAERHLREAVRLDDRYAEAKIKLAGLAGLRVDADEAERLLRSAISLDPRSAEPFTTLGDLYRQQGRLEDAARMLAQGLRVDPKSPDSHAGLGAVAMADDRPDDAQRHYAKAVALSPHNPDWRVRLAEAHAATGDYPAALQQLSAAVRIARSSPTALTAAAWLMATCPEPKWRDCKRAIELAEKAVDRTGGLEPQPLDALAAAYAECGRLGDAAITIRRAIDLATEKQDAALPLLRERLALYESLLRRPAHPPRHPENQEGQGG